MASSVASWVADRLYFGRGDGTFEEVTETHLVDQKLRYAFTR